MFNPEAKARVNYRVPGRRDIARDRLLVYTVVGPLREAHLGNDPPFWKMKSLDDMTPAEWESLCDGCARCCLLKLEDEDTGELHLTRLSCALLDIGSCRCSDYANRFEKMADCIEISPAKVREIEWLPPTCAYRLVNEGRDLYWWHPLVSGSRDTVHEAGISVRGWATSEAKAKRSSYHRFIIQNFEET